MPEDGREPRARKTENLRALVAARIRTWRTARRESLKSLARTLGVAESTLSMWESGKRFPNPENILCLAQVLGVAPCAFFATEASRCRGKNGIGADAR
jgi:transcriptional regulator with XRE-family HTH domain